MIRLLLEATAQLTSKNCRCACLLQEFKSEMQIPEGFLPIGFTSLNLLSGNIVSHIHDLSMDNDMTLTTQATNITM
ncbi:MAG TPA: hypothetical protein VE944_17125 [Nostoc sp.]|uniref:hypothetical protein n=1 Tax=Nostoc sp. TaxID=1180 RepID=UPI002D581DB5|nr:hypothetical protein [Nostoc sp.]HYX16052.1 hypothetical protein [Nostoc sp.]